MEDFKSGVINVNEGTQQSTVLFYMFSQEQLLDNTIRTAPNLGQWNINPYMLNPYQYTTGSGPALGSAGATLSVSAGGALQASAGQQTVLQPLVTDANIKADSVYCYGARCHLAVTNFASLACDIDLLWLVPKRDLATDPVSEWAAVLANKSSGQGSVATTNVVKASAVAGYGTPNIYGYSPFSEPEWNRMFKCVHREHHCMQAGSTKKFMYKVEWNKFLNRNFYQVLKDGGTYLFKGLTLVPVIIIRPSNTIVGTAPTLDCTTGVGRIGWTATQKFSFAALNTSRLSVDRVFPYWQAQPTQATAAADEGVIDETDEADVVKLATS